MHGTGSDDAVADDAVETALRALRHRDRSAAQIERQLEVRGVAESERATALATLVRTGLIDDERFAESRATVLAARGAGNALIRHDLAGAGIDGEIVEHAIEVLEDERERAERVVLRRGASVKTARYLAGKGFSEDIVHAVVARGGDEPLG